MRNREKSLVFSEIKPPIFSEERYVFLQEWSMERPFVSIIREMFKTGATVKQVSARPEPLSRVA